jgi:hypothetical protein
MSYYITYKHSIMLYRAIGTPRYLYDSGLLNLLYQLFNLKSWLLLIIKVEVCIIVYYKIYRWIENINLIINAFGYRFLQGLHVAKKIHQRNAEKVEDLFQEAHTTWLMHIVDQSKICLIYIQICKDYQNALLWRTKLLKLCCINANQ